MKRIEDYERMLDDLHDDLSRRCQDLRDKLEQVYDQDPSAALGHTEALTEVFRKLKTLKERGEVLRRGLDALREMDRLKAAILEQIRELGPQYARYCAARAALAGEGDQSLQALFHEADAGFDMSYAELEGAPIDPFRALEPESFADAAAVADLAPPPAPARLRTPEPPPPPFSTASSFEEEAGPAAPMAAAPAAAATLAVAAIPEPEPPPLAPEPAPPWGSEEELAAASTWGGEPEPEASWVSAPEPEPQPAATWSSAPEPAPAFHAAEPAPAAAFEPAADPEPAPEPEAAVSADAAALAAMLEDDEDEQDVTSPFVVPGGAETPVASLLSRPPEPDADRGPSSDPDPVDAMRDVFGDPEEPATPAMAGAAADLLSLMDEDDDDEGPAPALARTPAPPPAPGEVAGAAAAASLLAELEDDDDDDPFEGLDLGGSGPAPEDPLEDF